MYISVIAAGATLLASAILQHKSDKKREEKKNRKEAERFIKETYDKYSPYSETRIHKSNMNNLQDKIENNKSLEELNRERGQSFEDLVAKKTEDELNSLEKQKEKNHDELLGD
ncbi:hypothetical protein [Lachnospira multipara]|uniref:hypothetical protein n=1 Tax=Lachnospira multipara TaxID=28051 RepID=UPI00040A97EE|nr:hypothetical protein [Lachnospira multipara]